MTVQVRGSQGTGCVAKACLPQSKRGGDKASQVMGTSSKVFNTGFTRGVTCKKRDSVEKETSKERGNIWKTLRSISGLP
jgi:hypothetical protein